MGERITANDLPEMDSPSTPQRLPADTEGAIESDPVKMAAVHVLQRTATPDEIALLEGAGFKVTR